MRLRARRPRGRRDDLREARVVQPRRLGEGPRRARDGRGGRARRTARPGRRGSSSRRAATPASGSRSCCAVKGYRLTLVMPDSTALEHRQALEAYGAEVVLTPRRGRHAARRSRARRDRRHARARSSSSSSRTRRTPPRTGRGPAASSRDAFERAGALPDAFVAGVGTGGTITGVSAGAAPRRAPASSSWRSSRRRARCSPAGRRGATRIQGLGAGFVPAVLDRDAYDRVDRPSRDEEAWAMKARLAREEGLLVGTSSGAAVVAALRVARELGAGKVVATVLRRHRRALLLDGGVVRPRRGGTAR